MDSKVGNINIVKEENDKLKIPKKQRSVTTHYSTDIAQYELISPIGGVDDISYLYLALYIPTNEFVALKYTDLTISIDYALIKELKNTIINTHLLKHPNILPYYKDFIENDRLWTVTYPMKAGACSTILKDYFQDGFSEMMVSSILKEVLKAVYYLHSNNLVHNDIRASNILLDFNGDVKLTGYHQLSSLLVNGKLKKSIFTPIGDNHEWAAPEIIAQNTSHNQKSDIYSIGITALELAYNKTPFDEWPSAKILLSKIMYSIPMIKSDKKLSKNFWNFVSACVRKDPTERPSITELLEMPFIKKAKNTRFIESVLKKSGIINKHTAAIEAVMQNMTEITEKAKQAQFMDNEQTRLYNEELKRKQLEEIFSDDYSFKIDDLNLENNGEEINPLEGEGGDPNGGGIVGQNSGIDVIADGSDALLMDMESRTQNQSSQTMRTGDRISMNTSNSIIYQNQQQSLQSNNQQLVYTNPNSRSIPNSKSQASSLKYISSHSLVNKQNLVGVSQQQGSQSSQGSQQQIRSNNGASNPNNNNNSQMRRSTTMETSKSNSIVLSNNKNNNESDSRNRMNSSKSNSISISPKNGSGGGGGSGGENEQRNSKMMNSKSNSIIMSPMNGENELRNSRMMNSKSNSIIMSQKNGEGIIKRVNSKHSSRSVSVISNAQAINPSSKHNSQKILLGSEVFELRDSSTTKEKVIERNSSYNLIKENSAKHLILEEDEDDIRALNNGSHLAVNTEVTPKVTNYQISQPNILESKVSTLSLEPESKINNHSTPLLKEEVYRISSSHKKRPVSTLIVTESGGICNPSNRSSILLMSNRLSSMIANANSNTNASSDAEGSIKMKKSVSFTVSNEPNVNAKEINNEIYDTSKILKSSIIK